MVARYCDAGRRGRAGNIGTVSKGLDLDNPALKSFARPPEK
jgi:hypothetical protein